MARSPVSAEGGAAHRAVEVDIEPAAVATMPHAGLLELLRMGDAGLVHVLEDPDVGNGRGIVSQEMNGRIDDVDILVGSVVFDRYMIIKVKLVEVDAFDQVTDGLGLKAG